MIRQDRGNVMAILFISTQDSIHGQSETLLVSLKMRNIGFYFACLENSHNAGFASANSFNFKEIATNGIMQYFSLKKYVAGNFITHIHVFDHKALRLALWLKRRFPAVKIIGEWHERLLGEENFSLNKENAYLYALTQNKFEVFFCSSPELSAFLGKTYNMQHTVALLPYLSFSANAQETPLFQKKDRVFTYFFHSYCEQRADIEIVFQAVKQLMQENSGQKPYFFACLEKTEDIAPSLALARELGVSDRMVIADKSFFNVFYPLADCVLCASTAGEGDYVMLHKAWYDEKAVIASDLFVHTKFVLSDSLDCALLYPRDDVSSLCKCMQKVLQDSELREQLLKGGKQKILQITANLLVNRYLQKLNLL